VGFAGARYGMEISAAGLGFGAAKAGDRGMRFRLGGRRVGWFSRFEHPRLHRYG